MRLSTRNDDAGEKLVDMMCRHYRRPSKSRHARPSDANSAKITKTTKDDRLDVDIQWLIYFSTQ
jgi:hypothetical protein